MGRPPPIVCSWLKTSRETRLDGASFRPQPTSVAVATWEFGMAFVRMVAGYVIIAMLASVAFYAPVEIAQSVEDAATLTERAIDLYRAGRGDEAILLAQRALELREKALPPGHPDIASSFNYLAFFYHEQGRFAEAEPLYKRALELREKALPAGHPDIASSFNNLARPGSPRPSPYTSAHWRCVRSHCRQATLTSRRPSTTWPSFIMHRAGSPRPSLCTSAHRSCAKKHFQRAILMSRRA